MVELLYKVTQVSFVSHDHTVVVFPPDVLEIMQVMHVGGSHVVRVYNPTDTAQGVELELPFKD